MGFLGSIISQLQCLEILAWSLFAVGYPLLASIRALENKSNNDMSKLVAYWILFILFTLFELVLAKIIQWIPVWSCIKLWTVCWLVLPRFEQADFVYCHYIQPVLSEILGFINNYFSKTIIEIFLNDEILLALTKKFVEVNGSEALEVFVLKKKPVFEDKVVKAQQNKVIEGHGTIVEQKYKKPDFEDQVVKAQINKGIEGHGTIVEQKDKGSASLIYQHQVPLLEYHNNVEKVVARSLKSTVINPGIVIARKELVWNKCRICQVWVRSELDMSNHLRGKKHNLIVEELDEMGLFCSLCNISCSSLDNMEDHKRGRWHLKELEDSGYYLR